MPTILELKRVLKFRIWGILDKYCNFIKVNSVLCYIPGGVWAASSCSKILLLFFSETVLIKGRIKTKKVQLKIATN